MDEIKKIEERVARAEKFAEQLQAERDRRYLLSYIKELQSHADKLGEIITDQTEKRLELEARIAELVDKFAQSQIEKQIYKRSSLDGDDKIDELKVRVKALEKGIGKLTKAGPIGLDLNELIEWVIARKEDLEDGIEKWWKDKVGTSLAPLERIRIDEELYKLVEKKKD